MRTQRDIVLRLFPDGKPHIYYVKKEFFKNRQDIEASSEQFLIKDDRIVLRNAENYEGIHEKISEGIEKYIKFWKEEMDENRLNGNDFDIILKNIKKFENLKHNILSNQSSQEHERRLMPSM